MRFFLILLCLSIISGVALAQTPPVTSSGLPIPRFVSIKFDRVFARTGPDQSYPIAWIYQRQGIPVEITQEYNDWRHIRDADGKEGWLHKIQLSPRRSALVQGKDTVVVREDKDLKSDIVARLEPNIVTHVDKCDATVCKVEGDGYRGWIERKSLWGIYPAEDLH